MHKVGLHLSRAHICVSLSRMCACVSEKTNKRACHSASAEICKISERKYAERVTSDARVYMCALCHEYIEKDKK